MSETNEEENGKPEAKGTEVLGEVMIGVGAYVDSAHVVAAEIPPRIVEEVGTVEIEEKLSFYRDGMKAAKEMRWRPENRRTSTRVAMEYLKPVVDFLVNRSEADWVDIDVEENGPIVLTCTNDRKERFAFAIAPRMKE